MPLNLTKLTRRQASVAVDFGDGDVLNVTYDPSRITSRLLLSMAQSQLGANPTSEQAQAAIQQPAQTLAGLLTGWDAVTEDEAGVESPVPLDEEHLLQLPILSLRHILDAVMAHLGETPASAASVSAPASGATS